MTCLRSFQNIRKKGAYLCQLRDPEMMNKVTERARDAAATEQTIRWNEARQEGEQKVNAMLQFSYAMQCCNNTFDPFGCMAMRDGTHEQMCEKKKHTTRVTQLPH